MREGGGVAPLHDRRELAGHPGIVSKNGKRLGFIARGDEGDRIATAVPNQGELLVALDSRTVG